jgi:hypothetical protein
MLTFRLGRQLEYLTISLPNPSPETRQYRIPMTTGLTSKSSWLLADFVVRMPRPSNSKISRVSTTL